MNPLYLISIISIFGMEFCWLFAVLTTANQAADNLLSIPLLMFVFPVSFVIAKVFQKLNRPKFLIIPLFWIIWAILMMLMVKIQLFFLMSLTNPIWLSAIPLAFAHIFTNFDPALLIITGSAILWFAGRRLAFSKADFSAALTEFQFGLIFLILLFLINYMAKFDQSISITLTIIFFTLSLSCIAITHAQNNRSGFNSLKEIHWPGMIIISIAIIICLGIIISIIINPNFINLILAGLKWIWSMIEKLMALIAGLFQPGTGSIPPVEDPTFTPPDHETENILGLPEWLREKLSLGWVIGFTVLFLIALWRIASQVAAWLRGRLANNGGETERLKGAFRQDIINLIKRILEFIFRIKFKKQGEKHEEYLSSESAQVRNVYREMLDWGRKNGIPKQPYQTPIEYSRLLEDSAAIDPESVNYITGHYQDVRYGGKQPAQNLLATLIEKWHILRKTRPKKKST